jgi:DNA-binding NarL/FixJ family response regulator
MREAVSAANVRPVCECMIVDDNERFLAVARDRLTRDGVDVVGTARTQTEALEKAAELKPDVVLVDISLGSDAAFPDLRSHIVLISTRAQEDFEDLIAASPAAGFLPKNLLSARAVRGLVSPQGT